MDGARLLEVFDLAVCFEMGKDVEEGGGLRWVEGCVGHDSGGVYCKSCLCMGVF